MSDKKYIIDNPDIMAEWDWEKNNKLGISPINITYGTHKKAWWICKRNHSWEANISNRVRLNRGCPYCARQLPIVGENDLATTNPDLAKEWHPTKNGNITPQQVTNGSHKKTWWICKNGHEWESVIKNRSKGIGCPVCSNKMVVVGKNDLATTHPWFAEMWHPTKNGELTPQMLTYGSGRKVWWICKNGHEFQRKIDAHFIAPNCPICSSRRRTSFPEQAIYYYIKNEFPDAINRYKGIFDSKSMELDIYIPSLNIGIEFDGKLYHQTEQTQIRDAKKYNACKQKGIRLIRITDAIIDKSSSICDHKINILNTKAESLDKAICDLFKIFGKTASPNIKADRHQILSYLTATDSSLLEQYPEICAEWNYTKNGSLTPNMFHSGSNEKVWWICHKCGYEWLTAICERTGHDHTNCPKCARVERGLQRIASNLKTQGSIAKTHPELLSEWDFENNTIDPNNLIAGSSYKAWWVCRKCNHRWKTAVSKRTKNNSGCPCCANRVIVAGKNDLATTHPHCIGEWDFEKNTDVTPQNVSHGSSKKVWWKCSKCGYEYIASISSRLSAQHCPECIKKVKLKAFQETIVKKNGSFGEHCTHLLAEWNFDKNTIDPYAIPKTSGENVWWKCKKCNSEWQATILSRWNSKGCPFCAKKTKKQ